MWDLIWVALTWECVRARKSFAFLLPTTVCSSSTTYTSPENHWKSFMIILGPQHLLYFREELLSERIWWSMLKASLEKKHKQISQFKKVWVRKEREDSPSNSVTLINLDWTANPRRKIMTCVKKSCKRNTHEKQNTGRDELQQSIWLWPPFIATIYLEIQML